MEKLRTELVEAQKARTDFIKWKLLLVSGLGAAGLGFTKSSSLPYADLVLCCIPFVCAYTDLMCRHLSLRVVVIGEYISSMSVENSEFRYLTEYEKFSDKARTMNENGKRISAFGLEGKVYRASSLLLSVAVIIYSVITWKLSAIPILFSGIIGIILTFWIERSYQVRIKGIRKLSNEYRQNQV